MALIPCPCCGPRDSAEFRYVDERRERPDPETVTPESWRSYLYLRRNVAGWASELWLHRAGCRQYLDIERHTVTGEVRTSALARSRSRSEDR